MESIRLSELMQQVADVLAWNMSDAYWVRAEISELNVRNGHCYMELVEKDENRGLFAAKVRANCWAQTYALLREYFEKETGQTLHSGLQVLLEVEVKYHPVFGLSLQINDIDPSYTLGDLARQRRLTIERLKVEGVIDMNKSLDLPLLPRRLAVISSDTAAGYGDFCHQLEHNPNQYAINHCLFKAIMQGDRAAESIIAALERIYEHVDMFDMVAIIRGGGATADLTCFDKFELAMHCAQFPLPIITGIGHQRDTSVLDLVARVAAKTPTAVAEWILEKYAEQDSNLLTLVQRIRHIQQAHFMRIRQDLDKCHYVLQNAFAQRLTQELHLLTMAEKSIDMCFTQFQTNERNRLAIMGKTIEMQFAKRMVKERSMLDMAEKKLELQSPERILRRGYTLTLRNGKPLCSAAETKPGDVITTEFMDGQVQSIIKYSPSYNK